MPRGTVAASRVEVTGSSASASVLAVDDAALVARSAAGDSAAFRVLTERHVGPITRFARRMLHDDAEAEDVVQEAFLRLWRAGAGLDATSMGIGPWLRRVVSNLCIDRIRSQKRLMVVETLPEQIEAPRQQVSLEERDLQKRVDAALKNLPDRQRLALTLFQYEGLSQSEIGAEMQISDEAVESLLARARRQLRNELRGEWKAMLARDGSDSSGMDVKHGQHK